MSSNGNNGAAYKVELLSRTFTPKGWPHAVCIRELTAGDMLDLYEKQQAGGSDGKQVQFQVLICAAVAAETGHPLFTSYEEIRALPARMVGGLMEMLTASSELNVAQLADNTEERPTSPPAG